MNKSERELLSSLVSQMRTSYESTPEVVSWGETLLASFPCLCENINQYDEVQKIENITSAFTTFIIEMSSSPSRCKSRDREISLLGFKGREPLYSVFDHYFAEEDALDLDEIENAIGKSFKEGRDVVKKLIKETAFIEILEKEKTLTEEQINLYKGNLITDDWR